MFVLSSILLTSALLAMKPVSIQSKMKTVVFAFFVEAKNPPEIPKHLAEVYQKRHLDGFKEMYKQGKILAVGPLEDAGEKLGVIILDVPTVDEANELLKNDAWVKAGRMELEYHPWYCEPIAQKVENLTDIAPLWLGVLTRVKGRPKISDQLANEYQEGHMANIQKMAKSGDLFWAGPFADDTPMRGLFFFFDKDKKHIEELVAKDPTFVHGRLEMKLYRWWAPKGMFKPYVE